MPDLLHDSLKRLEVQDFEVLLAVAETGSFRKASAVLGIGQSAVTRRVQKLEDVLGVSLFERRRSGARLTGAGASFTARSRAIVDDLHAAIGSAQSAGVAGTGHLQVGLIASLSKGSLRDVVTSFVDQHPDVDICFTEANRHDLLTLLSHRSIDVVIAAGEPQSEIGDGLVLVREDVHLAVHRESALAHRDQLYWGDVASHAFVVSVREPGPEIHDYIVRHVSDLGRQARVQRHRLGREGIMNLVGLGLGVSLVADHWRGVQYPNVAFVPIGDETDRIPFSLTWRPENDNPALRRFISLARIEAKRAVASSGPSRRPDPSS
jgi:molybdate transport repressor ModE-like protein